MLWIHKIVHSTDYELTRGVLAALDRERCGDAQRIAIRFGLQE